MSRDDRLKIAERIATRESRAGLWHLLATPVEGVVSVKGSIETAPDAAAGETGVQDLMVAMLDKGTRRRSKRDLAEFLEDRGATTDFSSAQTRIRFSARCLSDDLQDVLGVLFEQITEPAFDEDEFQRVRSRVASNVSRQLTHTATRAGRLLSRRLYPEGHPNRSLRVEDELDLIAGTDLDRLVDFHARHVVANNPRFVIVGEIPEDLSLDELAPLEPGWTERPVIEVDDLPPPADPGTESVDIPDRPNLDIRIGHRLDLKRLDDDFLPLYVGVFALGGNFSSRLMSVVRDEMGLTYGIRSGLNGVDRYHTGHWVTSVTLSADRVDEGIRASRDVAARFLEEGVTEDELEGVKTTLVGSYEVRLETTRAIAATVLSHLERGYRLERLDTLPDEIEALSVEDVNEALSRHLSMDRLHVCSAGSAAGITRPA
ncbi:MAG: insulinase family protein [Rhodothermales bacterium]|nr:insulinase family protein [Rhodothermales bacterium]